MITLKPYKHDCSRCIWCGWIPCRNASNGWGNMYFCPRQAPTSPTDKGSIIIRFSDEPSEYLSIPVGVCSKGNFGISNGIGKLVYLVYGDDGVDVWQCGTCKKKSSVQQFIDGSQGAKPWKCCPWCGNPILEFDTHNR